MSAVFIELGVASFIATALVGAKGGNQSDMGARVAAKADFEACAPFITMLPMNPLEHHLGTHMSRLLNWIAPLVLMSALGCPGSSDAEDTFPKYAADFDGIYRVDGSGHRKRILQPKKGEMFIDSTLAISPNGDWALIDYVPSNPGKGRVEEVKILVSLNNGLRVSPDSFSAKYGVWLGELSDWERGSPATIVTEEGKHVHLH
jgi:hypothetical protein